MCKHMSQVSAYSEFDKMDTATLEEFLRMDLQLPEGDHSDMDAVLYIMDLLARRRNGSPQCAADLDRAWDTFNAIYRPLSDDRHCLFDLEEKTHHLRPRRAPAAARRTKRSIPRAIAGAAAALLIAVGSVSVDAGAIGRDIYQALVHWTATTFSITVPEAGPPETDLPEAVPSETVPSETAVSPGPADGEGNYFEVEYTDLQEVLDDCPFLQSVLPQWLPDGYSMSCAEVWYEGEEAQVVAITFDGDGESIYFDVQSAPASAAVIYPKDSDPVAHHASGGVEHYLMSDHEYEFAVWSYSGRECTLGGEAVTQEELIRMIDSIYGSGEE